MAMDKFEKKLNTKEQVIVDLRAEEPENLPDFEAELERRMNDICKEDEEKLVLWEDYERRFGVNQSPK